MSRVISFILFLSFFATACTVAEIRNAEIPASLVNASTHQIKREWGEPYKIYTVKTKLKYGADEVWVYKYPDTSSHGVYYYLYFKNHHLIKWDNLVLGDF